MPLALCWRMEGMPEGPSIIILREEAGHFRGKRVLDALGNTTAIDVKALKGKIVRDIKSWGKHFLICFDRFYIRIHLMMFGSYRIDEQKEAKPRLSLRFTNGELNFYTCSVKMVEGDPDNDYDWKADIMNPQWDGKEAMTKLKSKASSMVCDVILDQQIFSGAGNIIKNEVLYRIRVHPESAVEALPSRKLSELIKETVNYAHDFLKWKKEYTLKKHWLVHTKKICSRCNLPIEKKYTGKTKRRSFFCPGCQTLYPE